MPERIKQRKERCSLRYKGSLTMESAWILPLFILGMVILLSILDLYRLQAVIITSLSQSARELGMYAYCIEGQDSPVGKVADAACIAYSSADIRKKLQGENLMGIVGGKAGITLSESGYENGIITLRAVYYYKSPVAVIPLKPVRITAAASAQAWVGYEGNRFGETGNKQGEMVYITRNESVYHKDSRCTHLELHVSMASENSMEYRRNVYGDKYTPCEKCIKENMKQGVYYISKQGSKYHSIRGCSGLTRHIRLVNLSEIEKLRPCSRCSTDK